MQSHDESLEQNLDPGGGVWCVLAGFVFPGWYRLSYTKVWEFSRMVGQSREVRWQFFIPRAK